MNYKFSLCAKRLVMSKKYCIFVSYFIVKWVWFNI